MSGISTTITFTATGTAEDLVATTLVSISGNNQTGTVGKELDNPFVVEVQDQNSDALSGVTVTFAVTIGGGSISSSSVTTDTNGRAETTLTLGSTVGANRVTANVSGITTTRTFNATGEATVATTIVRVSGNNQTAVVSTALPNPFVVEVRDQDGDGLSGITVAFAVTAGGGTLSTASGTTGSNGRASSTLTLGSTAGTNTVTATASGITSPVTFTATATATGTAVASHIHLSDFIDDNVRMILVPSADGQAPIVYTYTVSGLGNPQGVTFDGTHIHIADSSDDNVRMILPPTSNGEAPIVFTYTVAGLGNSSGMAFDGTYIHLLDNSDDNIRMILPPSGNGQAAIVYTYTVASLGNPQGATFDGTHIHLADSSDDNVRMILPPTGDGQAPTVYTYTVSELGNPRGVAFDGTHIHLSDFSDDNVRMILPPSSSSVAPIVYTYTVASLDFGTGMTFDGSIATTEELVATSVVRISGNNQTDTVSTALSNPLVVEVQDQDGNAFEGATVAFEVTGGGGTLSTTSVDTGSNGRAEATLTLGSSAGTNTVTADVDGIDTTITFTATGTVSATSLHEISGDNQTGTSGEALGNPFVVEVRDENGDDYQGATVTFAVTAGNGTLSSTSVTTNASGRASSTLTLGDVGDNTVRASVSGITTTITFTATSESGLSATELVEVSGDDQSATVSTALPNPFVVEVRDQDGDAFSGATVAFSVTAGGGTLSATSVTTGTNGQGRNHAHPRLNRRDANGQGKRHRDNRYRRLYCYRR